MNTKIGHWTLAPSALLLAGLGACTSVRYTATDLPRKSPDMVVPVGSGPSHSSAWAGVLPADSVNDSPLAMAEYNADLDRNDASFGVVSGPAGQPLAYYASAEPPSLYLQYQFTLPTNANTVTVFPRGGDPVFYRPYGGYYRGR